jgi:hypothetical protein
MRDFKALILLIAGVGLVQGSGTSEKAPIVDLDYAVHQGTISVSCTFGTWSSSNDTDHKKGNCIILQLFKHPLWRSSHRTPPIQSTQGCHHNESNSEQRTGSIEMPSNTSLLVIRWCQNRPGSTGKPITTGAVQHLGDSSNGPRGE